MKKTLLLFASAALLFAGCAKEQIAGGETDGDQVTVTFTACLTPEGTKAVADKDGKAKKVNHWVMEVRDAQDDLFFRKESKVSPGTLQQTYELKLFKNQSYTLQFWADTKGAYNTDDLTAVSTIGSVANNDARDAFSANVPYTSLVSESKTVTLTRPFAQLNIITNDLKELKKKVVSTTYEKYAPEALQVVAKVPSTFDVQTQTAGDATEQTLTATASYANFLAGNPETTLFMDYIFASESKELKDIQFTFKSNGRDIGYNFSNIPLQRNYRTNIKGQLMSNDSKWTVTIDPVWNSLEEGNPDYNVYYYEPSSIEKAQEYIENSDAQKAKTVDLSKYTVTANDYAAAEDKKIEFKLKPTSPEDMVNFTLPEIPADLITAGCAGWKITHEDGYPTLNVNVTAPQGTLVTIDAPNSHVILNGTEYQQVDATTSNNTLVVPAGVTVKNLTVKKGAVEIHGIVEHLTVDQDASVAFKDCENLNDEVYAIAKQKIAEGYSADDATNSIVKNDFFKDENGVWHIMNAKAYKEFAAAVNGGTTFQGQTVVLDADIDFQNASVAPIGNQSDEKPFKGTFNGNNKKLSNVTVQNIVGKQGVGIFGKVYAPCVIKDLTVENATVIGDKTTAGDKAIAYVGGIAGHGYATIQNCTFKGDIYAGHQMGGIAGSGGFTITGCTFEGNIISERDWGLGGIIGNCQDGGAISGNTAKGTISAKNANYCGFIAGGIIGCAIYTTYDVKDNYAAMSMSYDGEAFDNVYPIVGVYNIDGTEDDKINTDLTKLLANLADNTWDKTISPEDSYAILYNNENPTETGYLINYGAATTEAIVAKIGETGYTSLEAAFAAAQAGQTIEIIYAGTYTLPSPISNLKIKGTDGVVFNAMKEYGQSVSLLHDVEFESVKFVFGNSHYTGFQHSESVTFTKCTFEGYFNSYGTMLFDQCTFNSPEGNYSMWCYAGDVTYRNCTINCKGKFVNAYNEGNTTADRPWKIVAEGCTFNSSVKNKAAFNIKATCGSKPLYYDVEIKNCTANGDNWPAVSTSESLVVGSALWQVDDINASVASKIKVTVDNTVVYGE